VLIKASADNCVTDPLPAPAAKAAEHTSSTHKGQIALDRMSRWFGRYNELAGEHPMVHFNS